MNQATDYLTHRPTHQGLLGVIEGMLVPWDGYLFLKANPRFVKFLFLPVLVYLMLTLACLAGIYYGSGALFDRVATWFSPGWLGSLAKGAVDGFFVILLMGLGAGFVLILGCVSAILFLGKMAVQVERELGVGAGELREPSLWRQTVDTALWARELILVNGVALLLNLVPVVGSFAAMILSISFNSYLFGLEFLELPLSQRGYDFQGRRRFARAHLPHVLGLGSVVFVFSLIPVLGSFFLVTALVGAVLLFRRLRTPT